MPQSFFNVSVGSLFWGDGGGWKGEGGRES